MDDSKHFQPKVEQSGWMHQGLLIQKGGGSYQLF
jgi:hypothetical protein